MTTAVGPRLSAVQMRGAGAQPSRASRVGYGATGSANLAPKAHGLKAQGLTTQGLSARGSRALAVRSTAPFAVVGAVALGVMLWAYLSGAPTQERSYLYATPTPIAEAAYCVAVAQRVGEITHGLGERKLEWYLREQTEYWMARLARGGVPLAAAEAKTPAPVIDMGAAMADGRARLSRDTQARGVNEQAHLHLALQRCGERSLAQGARVRSME